jgi:hypothetical protein
MIDPQHGTLQSLFDSAPALERQLAEVEATWNRARSRHYSASFGCACGAPMAHVSAADFELDLMDFIVAKYAVVSDAGRFLLGLERWDIQGLLSALASLDPAPDFARDIATDLSRSIKSFGGRRAIVSDR